MKARTCVVLFTVVFLAPRKVAGTIVNTQIIFMV